MLSSRRTGVAPILLPRTPLSRGRTAALSPILLVLQPFFGGRAQISQNALGLRRTGRERNFPLHQLQCLLSRLSRTFVISRLGAHSGRRGSPPQGLLSGVGKVCLNDRNGGAKPPFVASRIRNPVQSSHAAPRTSLATCQPGIVAVFICRVSCLNLQGTKPVSGQSTPTSRER